MSDEKDALRAQDSQSLYDFKNEERAEEFFREEEGFTEDIILRISAEKREPDWMRDFRLKCLQL